MKANGMPKKSRKKEDAVCHRRGKTRLAAVTCLAAAVVLCTVYALIMPAVALENGQELRCSWPVHEHGEDCYDGNGNLICGYADYVVHTHQQDYCYDADGNLICGLSETRPHEHDASCYQEEEVLVCGETQSDGHVHSEDCYAEGQEEPVCGQSESHTHNGDCYTRERGELSCTKEEHVHDESCYGTSDEPQCGQEESEGHVHGEDCYTRMQGDLLCEEEDAEHEHTDACYDWTEELTCGQEEGEGAHRHSEDCYAGGSGDPICGLEEHTHTDECYEWTEELTCGQEEGDGTHQHSAACYETKNVLTCEKPEVILHTHGDDCWEDVLDENDEVIGQRLACGLLQVEEHQHDESCVASANIALTALNGVPGEILQKLADKERIYPGEADESGVWTVYDTGDPDTASVKATVTLPEGTQASADHYLYIRAVGKEEAYYPDEEALKAAVGDEGAYADAQCWAIHWVRIYEENGVWKYDLQTGSVLGGTNGADDSAPPATVKIEYLKPDADLKGTSAHRKLQVYNSRNPDGKDLEDASTPTAVTANNDAYTGFTFETNRGGPYVFVSKTLYVGYVQSVMVESILDGSGPFDADDKAGNDSGESNGIIRSYDMASYNLTVNMVARSSGIISPEGVLEFEMTMNADITEAVFLPGNMLWLGSDYTIEYLDKEGEVVLTQGADGVYRDADGSVKTVNDIVSDSDKGKESYSSAIVTQRLRGSSSLQNTDDGGNILTGNRTYTAAVQVLNAANQSTIQPTFRAWFRGNEDNYGSENPVGGTSVQLAQKVTDNKIMAEALTVSAAARFNLQLDKNRNMSYKGWFDSKEGKEVGSVAAYTVSGQTVTGEAMYRLLEALGSLEENRGKSNPEEFTDTENACADCLGGLDLAQYKVVFRDIRYGRITGYGITLQVYNDAFEQNGTASKGFKGVSLPQGAVTFDLALDTIITNAGEGVDETQYYARLWEYNENLNESTGNQAKNMYWAHLASTRYAAWAAPYNSGNDKSACYEGGGWALGPENSDGTYPFTISGYDLNFLPTGLEFPTHRAGNSGATTGFNSYIGSFSAGYVQLLNVFPRTQSADLTLETEVTVKNLEVTTTDGQTVSAVQEDGTGYAHETNRKDNSMRDSIPLYAPGGMTKANAFCNAACFDAGNASFSGNNHFLGTDFWGTSYDCSAFAGQDITLVGAARIGAGDYAIRHMNILQLFDSSALSIDTSKKPYASTNVTDATEGRTTILYAADPKYKSGYDTNAAGVQERMSAVREEDLIYFTSLEELEDKGYICVGVLAELRNWTIYGEGGYSTVLKIPMKVSQEKKYLGKTVSTVNTVRIWTNAEDMEKGTVSWTNGVYKNGKNSVDGYTSMEGSDAEHYRGEVANKNFYVKTEYENGQVKYDTNAGGYVAGSSLLLLGYKSEVDIKVDNGGDGALPTYDMDKSAYTVNYHLMNILTKVDNTAGTPQDTHTDLTVLAKLDTEKEDGTEQRISVAASGYQMKAASNKMQLVSSPDSGEVLDSVNISTDPNNPTTVYYRLLQENGIQWKYYTIQVYAHRDTNGSQVTFELKDVTVGASVPDILFDALIDPDKVSNDDRIKTDACISGTSDVRAYTTTNGNTDSAEIGIVKLKSTNLVKRVDRHYIELDGTFTYTVTYTNTGNEPVSVYLYDLLPDPDDIRGSDYDGIESTVSLGDISANLSGEGEFTAEIQFYYSTLAYTDLYNNVRVFGSVDTGTGAEITDINARRAEIEKMLENTKLFGKLGTISSENNHRFMEDDSFKDGIRDQITGIYAVVNNLSGGRTLSITFTLKTKGNEAGNLYCNIANSWLGDVTLPLTSNRVETTVLSRTISGVVWHDADLNGVRDNGEELLSGVTATLFRWDDQQKAYVQVKGGDGPNGRLIEATCQNTDGDMVTTSIGKDAFVTLITGADGSYKFENLTDGNYVVAFSGIALDKYTGSTLYQAKGSNDSNSNDGVALKKKESDIMGETAEFPGIDDDTYSYAIAYNLEGGQASPLELHSIDDIEEHNLPLTNGVELYENQDLGLVYAYHELPQTGGDGTIPYTAGGLLSIGAGLFLLYKKRRKEDFASS